MKYMSYMCNLLVTERHKKLKVRRMCVYCKSALGVHYTIYIPFVPMGPATKTRKIIHKTARAIDVYLNQVEKVLEQAGNKLKTFLIGKHRGFLKTTDKYKEKVNL